MIPGAGLQRLGQVDQVVGVVHVVVNGPARSHQAPGLADMTSFSDNAAARQLWLFEAEARRVRGGHTHLVSSSLCTSAEAADCERQLSRVVLVMVRR
jgi:hypothetical protein